jgi:5-(carboxyamino)imidazole ribonucleotide mutase
VEQQIAGLEARGAAVFIAGSSRGIAFACEIAKGTTLPVLAVPVVTGPVSEVDQLLQPFLELPPGVAAFAIGRPGAINAALFAATILSGPGSEIWNKLRTMREEQTEQVRAMKL